MSSMLKFLFKTLLIALIITGISACTQTANAPVTKDGQLLVLVSAPPYVEFVNEIGGEFATGWSVIAENDDPASVEFSDEQVEKFATADVYLRTKNFPFEEALLGRLIERNPGLKVQSLTAELDVPYPEVGDRAYYHLSPNIAFQLIRKVTEALIPIDPEHGQQFVLNENDYIAQVAEKNAYLATALSDKMIKKISSTDDTFGYFAYNYALIYISPNAPSEEKIDLLLVSGKNPAAEMQERALNMIETNPLQFGYLEYLEQLIEKINNL